MADTAKTPQPNQQNPQEKPAVAQGAMPADAESTTEGTKKHQGGSCGC